MTESKKSTGAKLAWRVCHILNLLHQGDTIDKKALAIEFGVHQRSIERDLERMSDLIEQDKHGNWRLIDAARSTIPINTLNAYAEMAGTDKLFPGYHLPQLVTQASKEPEQRPIRVQPTAREDLIQKSRVFADLEAAIDARQECRFTYKGKPRHAQPYKLLHQRGVWYLSAEEDDKLKNFSLALILDLKVDETSRFSHKRAHLDYIASKKDVWFSAQTTPVRLRVDPEVAHYFRRRELLPDQQIVEDNGENGSLALIARIDNVKQLLPVVRWWLPHVRIVSPIEWHEELVQNLKQTLDKWGETAAPTNQTEASA